MAFGSGSGLSAAENENLVDYIRWMGDYEFSQIPFKDADALILCMIAYYDLRPVFAENDRVYVKDILPLFESGLVTAQKLSDRFSSEEILREACLSRRFGELAVRNNEDVLQADPPLQFAAMSFHDGRGMNFLAYRGTDSSLAGWKEDCMISFTETAAQYMAEEYARFVLPQEETWIMGGHSKGGNQVIYAAAHLSDEELQRVSHIYMLDGPGFCEEIISNEKLRRIEPLITRVIPEFDIVGKFFEPEITDTRIIRSMAPEGLGQHALASWLIDHGKLSQGRPRELADKMMDVVHEWITEMSVEERKIFIDELFRALSVDGTEDLNEITAQRFRDVLIELARSEITRQKFAELPKKWLADLLHSAQSAGAQLIRERGTSAGK